MRARVRDVPGSPDTRDACPPGAVDADEAMVIDLDVELLDEAVESRPDVGADEEGVPLNGSTVAEHHTRQAIVLHDEPANFAVDDADAAGFKSLALGLRESLVCVKKIRSSDHCRISCACSTEPVPVLSTPSG